MITNLQQTELDLVEQKILTEVFGGYQPHDLVIKYKMFKVDVSNEVQKYIDKFENFVKPFMDEQGLIDGKQLKQYIDNKMALAIPDDKFRLIDVYEAVSPFVKQFIGG